MALQEILKKYRIKSITEIDDEFEVVSNSGSTYIVKSITKLDEMGSMYFKYECNCPAWKRCRHINAVEQYQYEECEIDDEIMERCE